MPKELKLELQDLQKEAESLIRRKDYAALKELLESQHPYEISEIIEGLDEQDSLVLMRLLSKEDAAEVFSYLETDERLKIAENMTAEETGNVIENMAVDDAVDYLGELPSNMVVAALKTSSPERRHLLNRFLNYDDESAGGLMSVGYVSLYEDMTVREAVRRLRERMAQDTVYDPLFILSENRILTGVLSMRDLLPADNDTKIKDLDVKAPISVETDVDQEEVLLIFNQYDLLALPVTDKEGRLLGIVTADDILEVSTEEATRDIQAMAGVTPEETPYLKLSVFRLTANRVLWLMVLMVSGMIVGNILHSYEEAFLAIPILVSFIPMLTDTGGSAGAQTSSTIIRAMTLNEVKLRDLPKVVWKEFRVSLMAGTALAVVNFLRLFFLDNQPALIGLTVSLTLMGVVLIAKIVAAVLPLLAKVVKLDPTIMAAPLITTLVDAVGMILFFELAKLILPNL